MLVTEVRITLPPPGSHHRLLAYVGIVLDGAIAVHDLKVIAARNGAPFVAFPNRRKSDRCPSCTGRTSLDAHYCEHCGRELAADRVTRKLDGRLDLYADVIHPITPEAREAITGAVLAAYRAVAEAGDDTTRTTPALTARTSTR